MSPSSDLMYRLLVEGVVDYAIYMLDRDGTVLNWNVGAQRAKGYTAEEIVGRNYAQFYSAEDRALGKPQANLAAALRDGRLTEEGWRYRKDGSAFWASVAIESIYDPSGEFVGFAKITRDLTEQHEFISRIRHQATHDALTDIHNRNGFMALLEAELDKDAVATVYAIDLDDFRPINDRLGHPAGDIVLQAVAARLSLMSKGVGIAGRLGGDEFAILQGRSRRTVDPPDFAEGIVALVRQPIPIGNEIASVGVSIGVASIGEHCDVGTVMRRADTALYRAKRSGKNCVRFFDEVPAAASA